MTWIRWVPVLAISRGIGRMICQRLGSCANSLMSMESRTSVSPPSAASDPDQARLPVTGSQRFRVRRSCAISAIIAIPLIASAMLSFWVIMAAAADSWSTTRPTGQYRSARSRAK